MGINLPFNYYRNLSTSILIDSGPYIPIQQFPGCSKDQLPNDAHFWKFNLINGIGRFVIIFMNTGKIKDDRNVIFSKIIMV